MGSKQLNSGSDASPWYFTKASDRSTAATANLRFNKVSTVNTQTSVTSSSANGVFMTDNAGGTGGAICLAQQV